MNSSLVMIRKPLRATRPAVMCLAALFCLAAALGHAAQTQPTNRPPAEVVIPKSIFVTNDVTGRDPFFPNSDRRKLKVDPGNGPGEKTPKPVGPGALRLLGITTDSEGKRIALINNLTFAKGEELEVRAEGVKLKVRCVEIREKSVVVVIVGQTEQHELVLPEKLLPTSRE